MTPPALCLSHPEAAAELGLWAIFAACEANKAAEAKARQAQADKRLAGRRFWWRDGEDEANVITTYEPDN